MHQLLNQVDMSQDHPSAAVPFKAEQVHSFTLRLVLLQVSQVLVPLVPNNFTTAWLVGGVPEATDWNKHAEKTSGDIHIIN
jgi:hypothetical protein